MGSSHQQIHLSKLCAIVRTLLCHLGSHCSSWAPLVWEESSPALSPAHLDFMYGRRAHSCSPWPPKVPLGRGRIHQGPLWPTEVLCWVKGTHHILASLPSSFEWEEGPPKFLPANRSTENGRRGHWHCCWLLRLSGCGAGVAKVLSAGHPSKAEGRLRLPLAAEVVLVKGKGTGYNLRFSF